jgi:hypothetical protein
MNAKATGDRALDTLARRARLICACDAKSAARDSGPSRRAWSRDHAV